jgi:hypothetical protein
MARGSAIEYGTIVDACVVLRTVSILTKLGVDSTDRLLSRSPDRT